MSTIICGFSGIGKSTAEQKNRKILDFESSGYSNIFENGFRVSRNKDFPKNYIDKLEELMKNDEAYYYLLSCHEEVRNELKARGLKYIIVLPYDEYATWETFSWFTTTMRSILERYRDGHCGVPILIDNYPYDSNANDEESKNLREQNDKLWDDTIDRMIELLKLMDEDCPKYETEEYNGMDGWKKKDAEMDKAKDEFFKLFSEHFWRLWD